MSKVYVVTCGEYSDYHICEVFSDKKAAERYCAASNSGRKYWYSDIYVIDEREINDGSNLECQEDAVRYLYTTGANVCTYGERLGEVVNEPRLTFNEDEYMLTMEPADNPGRYEVVELVNAQGLVYKYSMNIYLESPDHEKASKIAQDVWAKFKAEKLGLV